MLSAATSPTSPRVSATTNSACFSCSPSAPPEGRRNTAVSMRTATTATSAPRHSKRSPTLSSTSPRHCSSGGPRAGRHGGGKHGMGDRPDLAVLLADPARAVEVPAATIPLLLTAAAGERERIGAVERTLLARLTGETVGGFPP